MKRKHRIIMQYFLKMLHESMVNRKENHANPFWLMIFEPEELKIIIRWLKSEQIPEGIDTMGDRELLAVIGDDRHFLSYLLAQMEMEFNHAITPTKESVFETLKQLEMESHCLTTIPLELWDEYDKRIYQTLCVKAGHPTPFYGIFKTVKEQEDRKIVNLIGKIYDSKEDVKEILSALLNDEAFQGSNLEIMVL